MNKEGISKDISHRLQSVMFVHLGCNIFSPIAQGFLGQQASWYNQWPAGSLPYKVILQCSLFERISSGSFVRKRNKVLLLLHNPSAYSCVRAPCVSQPLLNIMWVVPIGPGVILAEAWLDLRGSLFGSAENVGDTEIKCFRIHSSPTSNLRTVYISNRVSFTIRVFLSTLAPTIKCQIEPISDVTGIGVGASGVLKTAIRYVATKNILEDLARALDSALQLQGLALLCTAMYQTHSEAAHSLLCHIRAASSGSTWIRAHGCRKVQP